MNQLGSRILALLVCVPSLVAPCGCDAGGEEGDATAGGQPDDGLYRPPGNGVAIGEAEACDGLEQAVGAQARAIGCTLTTRPCPDLIRAQGGQDCLLYDQGTVQGCADFARATETCEDLRAAQQTCRVTPIEGSAPEGCAD